MPPPRLPTRHPARRTVGTALLVLLAAALAGCAADRATAAETGFGTMAGRWDGADWQGLGHAVLDGDTLYLVGHRPDPRSYYDEYVRVRVAFRGAADYEVRPSHGSLAHIWGGDAGYFPDARGELRIAEYVAAPARVRGTLSLVSTDPRLPWRFDGGAFDVPLYARPADVPAPPRR